MSSKHLTPEISDRICRHMNKDHQEALFTFACFYSKYQNPKAVRMTSITSQAMTLEIDDESLQIMFDHKLSDSEDAHKTLIKMLQCIQEH